MKLNKTVILIPRGKENVLCYKEIYLTGDKAENFILL